MQPASLVCDYFLPNGMRAVVITNAFGAYCGYVGVDKNHPLHGQNYNNVHASCHGGLTYSNDEVFGVGKDDRWWFGFDCNHAGDYNPYFQPNGRRWTVPEVKEEITRMAESLRHY